jgi:hypothetical protein
MSLTMTLPRLLAASLIGVLLVDPAAMSAQQPPADATRIVAVGDIHGDVDAFAGILATAGLIDEKRRWIGGRARLVVTGDYLDRGEHVRGVMDLLMRLETEAAAERGRVEALLGNHEGMNLLHFFRDVSPAAFAHFADQESEARRRRAYAEYASLVAQRGSQPGALASNVYRLQSEDEWMAGHPPGMLEYIEALGPDGHYGRWLRKRKPAVKLDDTIFMHGGLELSTAPKRLEDIGRRISDELRAWDEGRKLLTQAGLILPFFTLQETVEAVRVEIGRIAAAVRDGAPPGGHVTPGFTARLQDIARIGSWWLLHETGPLWFRGFATWGSPDELPQVEALLKRYGAARFVGGHTVVGSFRITPRFGRRVFLIDTGMLSPHYGGRASALEIAGDRITAIYLDGREVLEPREEPEVGGPPASDLRRHGDWFAVTGGFSYELTVFRQPLARRVSRVP